MSRSFHVLVYGNLVFMLSIRWYRRKSNGFYFSSSSFLQEISNGARIDVALNEKYDGSYIGPSRDIVHGNKSFGISKRGPVRRAPVSKILVCHPKRPRRFSLQEFLNEKDDNDGVDISGHNRYCVRMTKLGPKESDFQVERRVAGFEHQTR